MEENIKKLHEAAEALKGIVTKLFPAMSHTSVVVYDDGTILIGSTEIEKAEPNVVPKQRELFRQWQWDGEWGNDNSDQMNEYLEKQGRLLKKEG